MGAALAKITLLSCNVTKHTSYTTVQHSTAHKTSTPRVGQEAYRGHEGSIDWEVTGHRAVHGFLEALVASSLLGGD